MVPLEAALRMAAVFAVAAAPVLLPAAALAAAAGAASAAMEAGGLRLAPDTRLRLLEQDLLISRAEVRVSYVFENTADAPVNMLAAFPLPAMDLSALTEVPVDPPTSDPVNFVGFEASVDGAPVRPAVETRASRNGVDVSELLIRYGVPLSRFDTRLYPMLLGLNPAARAELTNLNLAEWDGRGNVRPLWTTRTTFYWPQSVPARGSIRIELRYAPVVGRGPVGAHSFDAVTRVRFCIDDAVLAAVRQRLGSEAKATLRAFRIRYALAADWAGPIGRFRLTLDKGDPRALLAVCLDGLRRINPTQYALERRDFRPDRDLDLLILEGGAR